MLLCLCLPLWPAFLLGRPVHLACPFYLPDVYSVGLFCMLRVGILTAALRCFFIRLSALGLRLWQRTLLWKLPRNFGNIFAYQTYRYEN